MASSYMISAPVRHCTTRLRKHSRRLSPERTLRHRATNLPTPERTQRPADPQIRAPPLTTPLAGRCFACGIVKGCSFNRSSRFRIMALTDQLPTITAYANDVGYDVIFAEQLKNFAQPGDLFMAISGSGNSPNVVLAMDYANSIGCRTIALTGRDGGKLGPKAQLHIQAPVQHMGSIEDAHMNVGHMSGYYFMYCKEKTAYDIAHYTGHAWHLLSCKCNDTLMRWLSWDRQPKTRWSLRLCGLRSTLIGIGICTPIAWPRLGVGAT